MMPECDSIKDIAQRPISLAIKSALDNIELAKKKKDDILKECVDKLANMNIIEELMEVHNG